MAARLGVLLMTSSWIASVTSMSNMVPMSACASMFPLGHEAQAQTSTPPYKLNVPRGDNAPGSAIKVRLVGATAGATFKGFFIKAYNGGEPIGTFIEAPKTLNCEGAVTGAHHADSKPKSSVEVKWLAPAVFTGDVMFNATVVMNQTIFWTDVVSNMVHFL